MSVQVIAIARPSRLRRTLDSDLLYSFRRSPVAIVAAIVAPWLAPHDPLDLASLNLLDSFKPPLPLPDADWSNPLGTDNQGRDILSAIMYGSRISLLVGFLAVGLSVALGVAVGLTAGYAGGFTDALLMRVAD